MASKSRAGNEKSPRDSGYSREEVAIAALKYFQGDELAAAVWVQKYALRDEFGRYHERTPDDMHHRLAREFARIERRYPAQLSKATIFQLLKGFRYIVPQGSPMAGIGNPYQHCSLSNCFVIAGPHDSYGGILHTDEEQAQLMKRRGGVGFDLSTLRPKGSVVSNVAGSSPGVAPFMERYAHTSREVAAGGRRGALMLTLSVRHPDAEEFIQAKSDKGNMQGLNLSMRIDDAFMRAVIGKKPCYQQFPVEAFNPRYKREADAAAVWQKIVHQAWKSGEPGVLFWDTILRESVPDCYADLGFRTEGVNPCGEAPLNAYDSCRLIALNLYSYVDDPFRPEARFNFEKFAVHVAQALRLADDLADLEIERIDRILRKIRLDPEPPALKRNEISLWQKIRKHCRDARRCGLGITGEGDMLAALNLRYGSEAAVRQAVEVHRALALNSYKTSVELARERGAFALYDAARESNNPFILRLRKADPSLYQDMVQYGRRNIAMLTIAPTGSVSILTRTSSGIEPVYDLRYHRIRKIDPTGVKPGSLDENGEYWKDYPVVHPGFITWLRVHGYDPQVVAGYPEKTWQALVRNSPYYRATATVVDGIQKVKMQGAVQKWVDHAISNTVNLPENSPPETVDHIYRMAWKSGCKGCTVFREGARRGVLTRMR